MKVSASSCPLVPVTVTTSVKNADMAAGRCSHESCSAPSARRPRRFQKGKDRHSVDRIFRPSIETGVSVSARISEADRNDIGLLAGSVANFHAVRKADSINIAGSPPGESSGDIRLRPKGHTLTGMAALCQQIKSRGGWL